MYTLKSTSTGKHIGSLFSDCHASTFNARRISSAYIWDSIESVTKEKLKQNHCVIVDMNGEEIP